MAVKQTDPQSDKIFVRRAGQFNENADTCDITALNDEYFRRARWHRATNLAATANYCASKGWLSEAGKEDGRKLWKITRRGYEHVETLLNSLESEPKEKNK